MGFILIRSARQQRRDDLEAFRAEFGTGYHDLRVGELQVIAGTKP